MGIYFSEEDIFWSDYEEEEEEEEEEETEEEEKKNENEQNEDQMVGKTEWSSKKFLLLDPIMMMINALHRCTV